MNNLDVAGVDFTATVAVIITGDIDGSGSVDMKDLLLAMQIVSGLTPTAPIHCGGDVNGDGRIGIEETIYALKIISEK